MSDGEDRVGYLLAQADALLKIRRYREAATRAETAAAIAPDDDRPFCEWARALYGEGRIAEAVDKAEDAIRLAPEGAMGFQLHSMALLTLAKQRSGPERSRLAGRAVGSARQSIRLAPGNPNGYVRLGQALAVTGPFDEASDASETAIRLAPNRATSWVAAGVVALARKDWGKAIAASERALAIDPQNYPALNNLGIALRSSGKKREGTQVLARAAREDPSSPTARRNLSRVGLGWARVFVLLLPIPVFFVAHLTFSLYVFCASVFVVASNVLISKRPGLLLRMERWAVPIALFFARGSGHPPRRGRSASSGDPHV